MSYTETFHCDVCGKARGHSEDWWLAWTQRIAPIPGATEQRTLKLTPWSTALSHDAEVRHLCGARCSQTLLDRWMRGE